MEINGPSFIILPTEPITCLAVSVIYRDSDDQVLSLMPCEVGTWGRQRVYAAPIEIPEAPEGSNDLSPSEILAAVEPTDVNHVWVISRLSGSGDVISLRTSSCVHPVPFLLYAEF